MRRIIVTGGAGFIGFNFVRDQLAAEPDTEVVVLDKLTYAGNPRSLAELAGEPRLRFLRGDIGDKLLVRELLATAQPAAVVHFAAESHVDRSIDGPEDFIQTNVVGTFHLLEECRRYLAQHADPAFRFVHVSTDEVFGALGPVGAFVETTAYDPRSPYSASKAASDHLVNAYVHTYKFPAVTTNCSNNYGPYQFPEKLIPLTIANALAGKRLPVYGKGENVRDWIYVTDHCAAIRAVLAHGRIGETYLVGSRNEQKNLDVVHTICDLLDELAPMPAPHRELIEFVTDRPGHDFRYAIDPSKIERELGWRAEIGFAAGIKKTIEWYLAHRAWTDAIRSGAYRDGL
ncbi:MAG TPA: dTDP-glucose 4,6-dehydratase [Kofleriaceae bacterium]|nr:dTDP-glucose 4,6-dehydratase [Kofleriaceae bacterium]